MTKKELTSVYYIKKEIKMWEEQLELIESKAEGKAMQITGLPFTPGTGSSDPMADLAESARKQHDRYLQQSQKENK